MLLFRSRLKIMLTCLCFSAGMGQFARADENESGKDAAAIQTPKELSATAERIFDKAQPRLLQIRTLLKSAQKQSSIGSGFLVGEDGRAVTNYHVVSQFALEPDLYQIEYTVADGARGQLKLLAIDVANDLAVVQLEAPPGKRFGAFEFDPVAVRGAMVKGERLFSLGNPLDLGFTIVEGTYNGMVDKSYQKHVHFTGAINPGMSGGPVVTVDNRIAGINVARNIGNDLVSFLVPASAAVRLLERAGTSDELDAPAVRKEIGAQMELWQKDFFAALKTQGFHEAELGPYRVAESNADWFNCWARTNRDERSKLRALVNHSRCDTRTHLFLAGDMSAGEVAISHMYLKSVDLGPVQFAQRLTQAARPRLPGGDGNRYTPFRCYENFLAPNRESPSRPELRVAWCARAYKDFAELYDVSFVSVTQDDDREALVSSALLTGVHFENALSFTQDFLAALKVRRDLD